MQQQSSKPLVSVCCLTYNHKETIAQTLDGILSQKTDFPVEVIVHDDASSDGTADIVRQYSKRFPNIIRPILQKENQFSKCNLAKTFVNPIMKGEFVAICEGDDYWTDPDKLQIQVDYMRAHPECSMCFHAVQQLESNGEMKFFHPLKHSGKVPAEEIINRGGMFCPTVSLVFRRDVLESWPNFRLMADTYDFPAQILAATMGEIYYIDRVMAVYRYASEGSWTSKQKKDADYDYMKLKIKWMDEFDRETGFKYHKAVKQELAHYLISRYKRTLQPQVWQMARKQMKEINFAQKCNYYCQYILFRLGGDKFREFWFNTKRAIRKDQV